MTAMRRSVFVMAATAVCVLLMSLFLQSVQTQTGVNRYEQHLQQPSEAELPPCAVCGCKAELCSHLPLIRIETGGQKIPGRPVADERGEVAYYETTNGAEEIQVSFSTVAEEGVWHHADDPADQEGAALLRFRGNSSRWFSKGSYRLKLIDGANPAQAQKLPLLGMGRGDTWALYGPFLDKTLLRNYMCMNLSARVTEGWVPELRFCELLLDGEYQGVYLLMEMIDVDEQRLALSEYRPGDAVMSYLLRIEPSTAEEKRLDIFSGYTNRLEEGRTVELLYPGLINQTPQVKRYVEADFSAVERLLYSSISPEHMERIREEVDLRSFADYYILMELFAINDSFNASTYFYRDARGKLSIGPVWDFNNAFDNFFLPMPSDSFLLSQRGWFAALMQQEDFVELVISRYRLLRDGVLSEENMTAYVKAVEQWLGSAVERNYEVWGYSFDPYQLSSRERRTEKPGSSLHLEALNPSDYEQAVQWLLDYMTARGRWMDEHIDSLRQYCHASKYAGQVTD